MELFPTNIAIGKAFCNRVAERKLLKKYITQHRHSVLIGPRRYGKTSLINQVLLESKLPYCMMELTMTTSVADMERMVVKHISHLLYSILPRTTQTKQSILKLFKWLNPELVLTAGAQKLIFHPERIKLGSAENIAEILKKLDDAAVAANKRVVVVMDEFQQLNDIRERTIEAAVRHAMQYSKKASYIFSGSNRHMLLSMFNSKNRPFYNSCEIIKLDRIAAKEYELFIQQAAKAKWHKYLPVAVLDEIFKLSELHPSYINRICGHFWLMNKFPELAEIGKYWQDLVESKRTEFTEEILSLSKNQKRVLAYLANNPTAQPSGHEILSEIGLSEPSARQAIRKLLLKDYLCKDKDGIIKVLDPAFRDYIKRL